MPTKQYVVGTTAKPTAGTNFLEDDFLELCVVNYCLINCSPEVGIGSDPGYVHSTVLKRITRATVFQSGDTFIVDYTPFCLQTECIEQ